MISFLCRSYGWTPDYVLKKLTYFQAFIYYDKAIEMLMIENGQTPQKRVSRKEVEAEAERVTKSVEEMKKKIAEKK